MRKFAPIKLKICFLRQRDPDKVNGSIMKRKLNQTSMCILIQDVFATVFGCVVVCGAACWCAGFCNVAFCCAAFGC